MKLEKCPFCGGLVRLCHEENPMGGHRWSVRHEAAFRTDACPMQEPFFIRQNSGDGLVAVAKWNTRSGEPVACTVKPQKVRKIRIISKRK